MGTVFTYHGIRFVINTKDEHNPPHVHVKGGGRSVVINLITLAEMSPSTFSPNDLRKIKKLVEIYRNILLEEWNEYHG